MIGGWGEFNRGELLLLGDWGSGWLVLFALAALFVLAFTWLDLRDLRRAPRFTLLSLRAGAIALGTFIALEPALELQHVQVVPNHIGVLVDTSSEPDAPGQPIALLRAEVTLDALRAVDAIERDSEGTHRVHVRALGGTEPPRATDADTLRADGAEAFGEDGTALLEGMRAFADEVGERDVAGFVLLTDGIDTGALGDRVRRGDPLDAETLEWLATVDAPVHTLHTGGDKGLVDVAVRGSCATTSPLSETPWRSAPSFAASGSPAARSRSRSSETGKPSRRAP